MTMKSFLWASLFLLVVQLLLAGSNVFVTLSGMRAEVVVSYRSVFGSVTIPPLLLSRIFPGRFEPLLERELYWPINLQRKDLIIQVISCFASALFGLSAPQVLSIKSMSYMDPSFASAMAGLNPVIVTSITLWFAFGEAIRRDLPERKLMKLIVVIIIGWVLWAAAVVGGAVYQGQILFRTPHIQGATPIPNYTRGVSMSVAAAVSTAISVFIQGKMLKKYGCYFFNMGLMSLMEAIQVTAYALYIDHSLESWKLGLNFRLWAVLYLGIIYSGILVGLMTFCMQFMGPKLVSVFNPVMLIISTFGAPFTSDGKFRLHSVISGLFMCLAMGMITWAQLKMQEPQPNGTDNDIELGNAKS